MYVYIYFQAGLLNHLFSLMSHLMFGCCVSLAIPWLPPVGENIYNGWVSQVDSCQVVTTQAQAASQGSPLVYIVINVASIEIYFVRALGFSSVLSFHQCSMNIQSSIMHST